VIAAEFLADLFVQSGFDTGSAGMPETAPGKKYADPPRAGANPI
jgi:hypothetical protein